MTEKKTNVGVRAAAVIVVVLILIVGGISITRAAAQSAIPGDALYPVKTTIEGARLTLAQDAGNRAALKMAFAEQRLQEIEALIEEGRFFQISNAVLEFEAYINSAIVELGTIADNDPARATELAQEIASALSRYAQTLTVMAATAPDPVRADVTRALDTALAAGSLDLPSGGTNDNGNVNNNDNGNGNDNGNVNDDDNGDANDNGNVNDNDDSNMNDNDDGNENDDDDGNENDDDDGNENDDDDGNENDDDDNGNENGDD